MPSPNVECFLCISVMVFVRGAGEGVQKNVYIACVQLHRQHTAKKSKHTTKRTRLADIMPSWKGSSLLFHVMFEVRYGLTERYLRSKVTSAWTLYSSIWLRGWWQSLILLPPSKTNTRYLQRTARRKLTNTLALWRLFMLKDIVFRSKCLSLAHWVLEIPLMMPFCAVFKSQGDDEAPDVLRYYSIIEGHIRHLNHWTSLLSQRRRVVLEIFQERGLGKFITSYLRALGMRWALQVVYARASNIC